MVLRPSVIQDKAIHLSVVQDLDDVVLLHRPVEIVALLALHHSVNLKSRRNFVTADGGVTAKASHYH